MATGHSVQLTKQVGEYLVAAELARLGLLAATFSGSVPDFDIIASDTAARSVFVQVKAVNQGSWQFDVRKFVDTELKGRKQLLGELVQPKGEIVCVLVALGGFGKDRFYVLPWKSLQKLVVAGYSAYLEKHKGERPRRFDSFHCQVREAELVVFKDKWVAEFRDRLGLDIREPAA